MRTAHEVFITDILGEEDFFGDMDFKVCGHREGVTGFQLDLKARGIRRRDGRDLRAGPRGPAGHHRRDGGGDPRAPPGPLGQRPARDLDQDPQEDRQAHRPGRQDHPRHPGQVRRRIDVEDDGTVLGLEPDGEKIKSAEQEIEAICEEIKAPDGLQRQGREREGLRRVHRDRAGTDGMCHISELAEGTSRRSPTWSSVGDEVTVKVILVDDQGRIKLSRKQGAGIEAGMATAIGMATVRVAATASVARGAAAAGAPRQSSDPALTTRQRMTGSASGGACCIGRQGRAGHGHPPRTGGQASIIASRGSACDCTWLKFVLT